MKIFPNESLKSRVTLIMVLVASLATFLTSMTFMVYDLYRINSELRSEFNSLADVIGSNSTAALEFMDENVGKETLNALENNNKVLAAYIYTENKDLLASFERESTSFNLDELNQGLNKTVLSSDYRSFERPILLNGKKIGTIFVVSDLEEIKNSINRYIAIVAFILAVNLVIIYFLSVSFQELITKPISDLADLVGRVSTSKDYSIRADKQSNDEIGYLVDKFNEMLAKIQTRDEELQSAHSDLEIRVRERTVELEKEVYERKKITEVLRESQKLLNIVMDNIPQAIYWKDTDSVYLGCNRTFAQHAGLEFTSDIFGKTDDELPWTEEETSINLREEKSIFVKMKPQYHSLETQRQHNNKNALIEVNRIPLFDSDNNIVGLLGAYEDITERSAMEEDLARAQRLESLGILAGGIAHDFNNLLTGIIGNITLAETLLESGEDISERLKDAEIASMRAKDLTMQLLTFSKGGEPIKKVVSLNELLDQSVKLSLRGSHTVCNLDIEDNIWPVEVDEGQITQVVNNIIINANQAMPEGGTITIMARNFEVNDDSRLNLKAGKYVKVSIIDQGIGIPEEYIDKVFDPYFSTKKEGHGLGLATCYSIIKKHEGLLYANSQLGKGSEFIFYIPANKEHIEELEEIELVYENGGGNVLIMDDEEIIRTLAGEILQSNGYHVEFAKEGKEAIELYKVSMNNGDKYDLIILDLTVPGGLGGKDTISEIRKIDPDVKAIVSSGYSNDPVMAEFQKYGFMDFVPKPYNTKQLVDKVNKVISAS